ncbi:MBOAT family O-acyltransferase [Lunatimonas salinarum]|uniref:MBOAT family O-acyltransferase n=1 Tax=Lunatimonas salinarum TaxID=1774590 RepID=UPI001AE08C56|nr:MBOAT family protein [Lunatimonas salinarum]
MLFNSLEFGIFLPLVFALYWIIPKEKTKLRTLLLLLASYFFYGWWDPRFLGLIFVSSLVDFWIGTALDRETKLSRRKLLLYTSLITNLGILLIFKYFNFFVENFTTAFTYIGVPIQNSWSLNLVLPVGISFYTFQTLGYTIDVYKKKVSACRDPLTFFAYVSFFPQLVAGPIERATSLLPQFATQKTFDSAQGSDGLRLILWGLFKKVVIADGCAEYVNQVFAAYEIYQPHTLFLAAVLFAIQIYGDFSGYSDVAIGIARLFGFSLMRNFAFPYFSRDIAEFWKRWHISLTTWLRDYLYIPLGGGFTSNWLKVKNVLIVFMVSGIWHGANWTFVVFGLLHGMMYLPILFKLQHRSHGTIGERIDRILVTDLVKMVFNFAFVCFTFIFFRSESLTDALAYLHGMLSWKILAIPTASQAKLLTLIALMMGVEWLQRFKRHGLDLSGMRIPKPLRWTIYASLLLLLILFGREPQDFLYFQF